MPATNSYIQVAADGVGKKMQTYLATIGTDDVHAEAVRLVDANSDPLGTTGSSLNVSIPSLPNIAITTFQGGASMANGQVVATNVAATLVVARSTRRSVSIRNLDTTNNGFIGVATVTSANGMRLRPSESISVDFVGLIQVITQSGNANFAYLETYD